MSISPSDIVVGKRVTDDTRFSPWFIIDISTEPHTVGIAQKTNVLGGPIIFYLYDDFMKQFSNADDNGSSCYICGHSIDNGLLCQKCQ